MQQLVAFVMCEGVGEFFKSPHVWTIWRRWLKYLNVCSNKNLTRIQYQYLVHVMIVLPLHSHKITMMAAFHRAFPCQLSRDNFERSSHWNRMTSHLSVTVFDLEICLSGGAFSSVHWQLLFLQKAQINSKRKKPPSRDQDLFWPVKGQGCLFLSLRQLASGAKYPNIEEIWRNNLVDSKVANGPFACCLVCCRDGLVCS